MRINNNISAMNTSRQLGQVSGRLSRSMEKLSSGLRIARAADDAAGLAVSEKLRGQIRGVNAAVRAQQDSVSGLQVAEGALSEVSSMLTRARELEIQFSGTSDTDAQAAITAEFGQIKEEITNIVQNTEYNGQKLLYNATTTSADASGSFSIYTDINGSTTTLSLTNLAHTGQVTAAADDDADLVENDITNIALGSNGYEAGADEAVGEDLDGNGVTNESDIGDDTMSIQNAINQVATARGKIGSYQNRFEASIRNFEATAENLQAAESRIRDVDMAKEMVGFTKDTIIQQAAQAMLVQANQLPQNIVGLLR
jgi:flagellin